MCKLNKETENRTIAVKPKENFLAVNRKLSLSWNVFLLVLKIKVLSVWPSRLRYRQATFINRLSYPDGWMLKDISMMFICMDQKCFRLTHIRLTATFSYTKQCERTHTRTVNEESLMCWWKCESDNGRACVSICDARNWEEFIHLCYTRTVGMFGRARARVCVCEYANVLGV